MGVAEKVKSEGKVRTLINFFFFKTRKHTNQRLLSQAKILHYWSYTRDQISSEWGRKDLNDSICWSWYKYPHPGSLQAIKITSICLQNSCSPPASQLQQTSPQGYLKVATYWNDYLFKWTVTTIWTLFFTEGQRTKENPPACIFELEKLLQKVQQTGTTRQQFVKYFQTIKKSKSSF